MADESTRRVGVEIGVTTSGRDKIVELAQEVRTLAREGGDAAPEFQRLGDELEKLGQQAQAVERLQTLAAEIDDLRQTQDAAAATATELKARLDQLAAASQAAGNREAEAAQAVREARTAYEQQKEALAAIRVEYTGVARQTDEYETKVRAVRAAILEQRTALREARDALVDAREAAASASAAEADLARQYRVAAAASNELNGQVSQRVAASREVQEALRAEGVAVDDLAGASTRIVSEYAAIRGAASALTADMQRLAQAERAADEAAQFERLHQSAAKMVRDAEYVRDVEAALNEQAAAAGRAERASAEMARAFETVGVRSAQALENEIRQIEDALTRLAGNSRISGDEFDRAFQQGQARIARLKQELAGVPAEVERSTRSTRLLSEALGQMAGLFGAFEIGSSFVEANTQLETLRRTMTLVTGSTQDAERQIAFLRNTADKQGVSINALAGGYSRFAASARLSGVSMETVNQTFATVTAAAAKLGLSSDDTAGALNALAQMASKGKVSMEELSQQLGDRLPAVLATTAKGLGVTTAQLTDLIASGKVLADESFFKAFAGGMEESFKTAGASASGLAAEIGRLRTAWASAMTSLGDSGVTQGAVTILRGLVVAVGAASDVLTTLGKTIGIVIGAIAQFAAALATLNFAGVRAAVSTFGDTIGELTGKFGAVVDKVAPFMRALGGTQTAVVLANDALKLLTGRTDDQAKASQNAAGAQKELGDSAAAAAGQAAQAGDRWVALQAKFEGLIKTRTEERQQAEKSAEAVKLEGQAREALARIGGDENEMRTAAALTASQQAEALAAVASKRESEADLTRIQIEAMREEATASNSLSEARKKLLADLGDDLVKREALQAQAQAAAESARIEAQARVLAIQTAKDNSGALDQLTRAYQAAQVALEQVQRAERDGKATKDDVQRATLNLRSAEALRNDALDDSVAKLQAKARAEQSAASIELAGLNLKKATIDTQLRIAQLDGDEVRAKQLLIQSKQLDIDIARAKVKASIAEADAIIAVTNATKAELVAKGQLTPAKQAEIDAAIANADVKRLEAKASEEAIKLLEKQVENLRIYGDESGKARKQSTDALTGETNAFETNSRAIESNLRLRQQQIEQSLRGGGGGGGGGGTGNGFTNSGLNPDNRGRGPANAGPGNQGIPFESTTGNTREDRLRGQNAVDNTFVYGILQRYLAGDRNFSDVDLGAAQQALAAERSNLALTQDVFNRGFGSLSNVRDQEGTVRALEDVVARLQSAAAQSARQQTSGTTQSKSGSRTVNINIGGKSTSIEVGSQTDSDTLVALLRQIENAQGRSS